MTYEIAKIFVILCAFAVSSTFGLDAKMLVKLKMANDLQQAMAAIQRNPTLTAQCFANYQPQLNAITDRYEQDSKICSTAFENSKDAINKEVEPDYNTVKNLASNVCNNFRKCNQNIGKSYDFFECNHKVAPDAINLSHSIKTTSKDKMEFITMKTNVVQYDYKTCSDKCSQKYVAKHSKVYGELQNCLNGKNPPAEITTTTTSIATTSATSSIVYPTPPTVIEN